MRQAKANELIFEIIRGGGRICASVATAVSAEKRSFCHINKVTIDSRNPRLCGSFCMLKTEI